MKVALYSLVHDEISLKIVTEIVAFFASKGAGIQVEKELLQHIPNTAATPFDSHANLDPRTAVFLLLVAMVRYSVPCTISVNQKSL